MRALAALIVLAGCSSDSVTLPDAGPGAGPGAGVEHPAGLTPYGIVPCKACSPPPSPSCSGQTEPVLQVVASPHAGDAFGANADAPAWCGGAFGMASDLELQLELPDLYTLYARADLHTIADISLDFGRCGGGFGGWGSCDGNWTSSYAAWGLNHVPEGRYHFRVSVTPYEDSAPFSFVVSGVIQPNGRCDLPLAVSGALTCAPGTSCNGTRCVNASECADGVDSDGDGLNGYPSDPGCSSITDPSELDDCPGGLKCAPCANLTDEDGDGRPGFPTDPGCASPGDLDESDECQTEPFNCPQCGNQFDDDDDGKTDLDDPSCGFAGWDDEWPED